jgi:hypothetical protein
MVPPLAVVARASRSEPAPLSCKFVTVLGIRRSSKRSSNKSVRGRRPDAARKPVVGFKQRCCREKNMV